MKRRQSALHMHLYFRICKMFVYHDTTHICIFYQTTEGRTYSEKRKDGVDVERQEKPDGCGKAREPEQSSEKVFTKNNNANKETGVNLKVSHRGKKKLLCDETSSNIYILWKWLLSFECIFVSYRF